MNEIEIHIQHYQWLKVWSRSGKYDSSKKRTDQATRDCNERWRHSDIVVRVLDLKLEGSGGGGEA